MVPLVLLLSLLGPGAASASPLTQGSAYAYGAYVSVAGSDVISPTPEASAGPAPGTGSNELVTVPLDTAVFTGVAGAKAQTTQESTIGAELGSNYLNVISGGPELPSQYNVQAYARTSGVAVLADEVLDADTVTSIIDEIGLGEGEVFPALVSADLVHSEALVACVDGGATVVAGGQVAGLGVLGTSLTDTVDGTLNQVIDLGDTVLAGLGATLVVNEVIETANGVDVNALRLTIPSVAEVILAHSEVSDTTCDPIDLPECSDGIDNDGDGKIDFPADPGCTDALDDDERDLVRTGGNGTGLGLAIFGAGGLLMLAAVRMRKGLFANNS
ncbi:MAG: hypothetical protein WD602_04285 [Actinomycetota bacterium]